MVATCLDVKDYLEHKNDYGFKAQWLDTIGEVAKNLETDYFHSLNPAKGEYIYGDTTATNPLFSNKKNTILFWAMTLTQYR